LTETNHEASLDSREEEIHSPHDGRSFKVTLQKDVDTEKEIRITLFAKNLPQQMTSN
jgi:hypothetical protein